MPRYRIFVVFHDTLKPEYYDDSVRQNFVFVNVNPHNLSKYPALSVINLFDMEHFSPLGKWYTESEVIYNVFKNPYLYEDVDFVGFLQYDVDSSPLNHESMQQLIQQAEYISFQPHILRDDYQQKILMDETQPNVLSGRGKNCYDTIFEDFNRHYHTNFAVQDWLEHSIGLCSCFLIRKEIFNAMMTFVECIIQSKKLDRFDTLHRHRIQGGLLERYYAIWFLLNQITLHPLSLEHHYLETQKQNVLIRRLIAKITRGLHAVWCWLSV